MTRDEFMYVAGEEINSALSSAYNRLMNLVQRAWAEGKRNAETEHVEELLKDALRPLLERNADDGK